MFKEGDFIKYKEENLLIVSNKYGAYSFYIILRKSWVHKDIYIYEMVGIPLKEDLIIIDNDNPLKLEFMEACLKKRIRSYAIYK